MNIEYFFAIGSPWAFIGLDPLTDLAGEFGATITPRPIPLIEENGGIYSKDRPAPRRTYWMHDLRRWAAYRGKVLQFDGRAALGNPTPVGQMVIAAGDDWLALTAALQSALWERAEDIADPDIRASIADGVGLDGKALVAAEQSAAVQNAWSANIADARARGVFGAPTYAYDGQLYWGQDSLPFLKAHLEGKPLA